MPSQHSDVGVVLNERGKRYGEFESHAGFSQLLKEVIRGSHKWDDMEYDQREALEMIAHKIGRILNGDPNFIDSWLDIEGYTRLVRERLEREQAKMIEVQSKVMDGYEER